MVGWMLGDSASSSALAGHVALVEPIVLGFMNGVSIVVERFPTPGAPLAYVSDCESAPFGIGLSDGRGFDDLESISSYLLWGARNHARDIDDESDEPKEPRVRKLKRPEQKIWETIEELVGAISEEAWTPPLELDPSSERPKKAPPAPEALDVAWLRQHTQRSILSLFSTGEC